MLDSVSQTIINSFLESRKQIRTFFFYKSPRRAGNSRGKFPRKLFFWPGFGLPSPPVPTTSLAHHAQKKLWMLKVPENISREGFPGKFLWLPPCGYLHFRRIFLGSVRVPADCEVGVPRKFVIPHRGGSQDPGMYPIMKLRK